MQAFHKLVGVQNASSDPNDVHAAQPNVPVTSNTLNGDDDNDARSLSQQRVSRASLPLHRRHSQKSLRSSKRSRSHSRDARGGAGAGAGGTDPTAPPVPSLSVKQLSSTGDDAHQRQTGGEQRDAEEEAGDEDEDEDEDFAWGPTHPCFPHPNPHCPPSSPEHTSTRVIRVRRDWLVAGDLYPQYANLYPEILDPLVSDAEFRFLISRINSILQRAFSPFTTRAWMDSVLGAATGYFWDDLGLTGARSGEKELERFIDKWNQDRERERKEVRMVHLRRTGFMSLDFIVPDPGIDAGEEHERRGG